MCCCFQPLEHLIQYVQYGRAQGQEVVFWEKHALHSATLISKQPLVPYYSISWQCLDSGIRWNTK